MASKHYSLLDWSFVLIWRRFFSSLLLCNQQQEFEFRGSYEAGSSQVSSSTKTHASKWFYRRASTQKNCFPKQTLYLTNSCAVLVLSSPIRRLFWMVQNIEFAVRFCWTTAPCNRSRFSNVLDLIDAAPISPIVVLNQNAKSKGEEIGSFSKIKPHKLLQIYT